MSKNSCRVAFLGVAIAISIAIVPVCAQSHASVDSDKRSRLTSASLISSLFPLTSSLSALVPLLAPQSAAIMPWIANPLLLGAHIPLYWVEPSRAWGYSIAGLSLPAAGIGLMFAAAEFPVAQPISSTLLGGYAHVMQYSAHDTCRLAAEEAGGYGLAQLAVAPFTWDAVKSPLVWIPSIVAPAASLASTWPLSPTWVSPCTRPGDRTLGSWR